MRLIAAIIVLAAALPLLGGCGQTGPLYLPEKQAPAPSPAPPPENAQPGSSTS